MKNTEIEKEANTLSLHNSTGCNDDKYRNREANTETDRQKNTETVEIAFSGTNLETGEAKFGNNAEDSEEPDARS